MAKQSVIARQRKREKLVQKYAAKRAKLKAEGNYVALDKLPKNASPVRLRNRCRVTGRGRGILSKFGLCRHVFRELASNGHIPGVKKSS